MAHMVTAHMATWPPVSAATMTRIGMASWRTPFVADAAMAPDRQADHDGGHGLDARPLRVLLVASAGGHWIELTRLVDAFAGCDCQFVSTACGMTPPLGTRPVIVVADTARDAKATILGAIRGLWGAFRRFDPDLVVSTGAAPGALALYVARLFGARTIWIDSIANSERLSLSGSLVRPVADLTVTQWPEVAARHPRLRYLGQIL